MTSRPIDAAVVEAFLAAIAPVNVRVATQVMDQMEQERQITTSRRQRSLWKIRQSCSVTRKRPRRGFTGTSPGEMLDHEHRTWR
jgi:hypothetical protein